MPDSRPDQAPPDLKANALDAGAAARRVRQRGRNYVIGAALLLWVLVIYFAVMFKIDNDIKHPPSAEEVDRAEHVPAAPER